MGTGKMENEVKKQVVKKQVAQRATIAHLRALGSTVKWNISASPNFRDFASKT